MSSTSTTWTTDTNTKSGVVQVYSSNVSVLKVVGDEGGNAILDLFADQGDDNADKWRMWVNASDDDLHFANYTSGSWANLLTIQDGGNVGIGVDDPDTALEIFKAGTQLKLSYDATNYASFTVAADGLLNIVTVDPDGAEADICLNPDGNVGIGTITPDALFHLEQATCTLASPHIRMVDTGDAREASIVNSSGDLILATHNTDNAPDGQITLQSAGGVLFSTGSDGAADVAIDTAGNVGIGTTSPDYALEVEGSANNHTRILNIKGTGDSSSDSGGMLRLSCNDGAVMLTGQQLGRIDFMGADSASTEDMGASIYALANGNWDGDTNATDLIFATAPDVNDDALGSPQRRMTIDKDGDVGIGKATPDSRLHVLSSINGAAKATIHCECN